MKPSQQSGDFASALMIIGSLVCIGIYVVLVASAASRLEVQLDEARRERAHFERLCEEKDHQMNGALEEIHKLKGDDAPR